MLQRIQEWDEYWVCRINGHKYGDILHSIFVYFTHIGSVIPWIAGCLILFLLHYDQLAAILGSGLILFGIIQFLVKLIIRRKRPYKNEKIKDKIELRDFLLRNGGPSLPSGHVTTFVLQTLILTYYFNNFSILVITVCGLLFVGYSRIYLGAHYPTDVIAGIFFGIALLFLVILLIPTTLWFLERIEDIFFII